jgi:hypothetical protein
VLVLVDGVEVVPHVSLREPSVSTAPR